PSCNLIVRRAAFEAAGGFDPTLFVAEDSHLCAEIRRNGFRIHFVPDARVYHYRKPLFRPFLRQIWNAGWYRARLVRRRRSWDLLAYSLASVAALALGALLLLSRWSPLALAFALAAAGLYAAAVLVEAAVLMRREPRRFPYLVSGLVLVHVTYAAAFLGGLFSVRPSRAS